jgi:FkbM family methyltransferase
MSSLFHFVKDVYWELRAGRAVDLLTFAAYVSGRTIDLDGVKLRLHRQLSFALARSIVGRKYEASERKLLEAELRPDDTVMELGAGLGYISAVCTRIVGSERVFTYEANPRLEPLIRDTFALNQVSPTLSICMGGKQKGTIPFFLARDFWVSSTVRAPIHIEEVTVGVVPLQEEIDRIKPTVFIADIEGGEYELFRDFSFPTCRLIMIELHPHVLGEARAREVVERIEAMGLRVKSRDCDCYLFERA